MSNEEIVTALKEEITLLYNCTDDSEMKARLKYIASGLYIDVCKCDVCGHKMKTNEAFKSGFKILSDLTLSNEIPKLD